MLANLCRSGHRYNPETFTPDLLKNGQAQPHLSLDTGDIGAFIPKTRRR